MTLGHLRQNAIAYLALVVALSTGSAYAAAQIANGSVTTQKIRNGAVTSAKIKDESVKAVDLRRSSIRSSTIRDGSVTSADVADGSLTGADIKDDSITRADILGTVVPGDGDVFNSTAVPGGPAPATPAQTGQNTFAFTTDRNGKLNMEFFAGKLSVDCGAGNQGQVAIFIDGAFQAGTLTNVPGPADAGAVQIVTNQTLAAGAHILTTTEYCVAGTHVPSADERVTWQVEILAR